ncbi:HAD domain-containing protein [Burkholderia cenocepacia]|uniref:HAD domain-containing protein n=1 Tax=Burkholderia cenocepacia TaxID=95486 RepID=UPI0007618961|nr:HAD domain-containing protein [Burkholderia cenocepacia]KWU23361.1 hypothetical protein AS149_37455 [Burkholderia cenocepacia]
MNYITTGIPSYPVRRNNAKGHSVLYLDFDGVLHPNEVYQTKKGIVLRAPGHNLFEHAPIIERLLTPYPDVRIVLSTSWVLAKGFSFARDQLPEALRSRVIGATFHRQYMRRDEFVCMSRGMQVYSDSTRRGAGGWIALDDDSVGWPKANLHQLVFCEEDVGLGSEDTQRELVEQLDIITRLATAA